MSTVAEDTFQPPRLEHPQLQQIADRVLHTLQLAAEKAVAHLSAPDDYPMPGAGERAEQVFLKRLRDRPAERQQAAIVRFQAITAANRQAAYGDLAQVDLRSTSAIAAQVDAIPSRVRLSPESLPKPPVTAKSGTAATVSEGVRLRLHKVHCLEETDGFLGSSAGSDEILLGGVAVDAAGNNHKITAFKVGDFDTGDGRTFSPPRTFAPFNFAGSDAVTVAGNTYGLDWPRTFQVTFALCEQDNGGFPEFLQDLFELAKKEVVKYVAAAVAGAGIGATVGNIVPGLGTALGAAIGAAVGWVMAVQFQWLVTWWEDDNFVPLTAALTLQGPTHKWDGKTDSANVYKWWKGHGGHYRLYYDWQMFGEKPVSLRPLPLTTDHPFSVGAVARPGRRGGTGQIDVFGRGKDDRMYHAFWNGGVWSGWGPVGEGTFDSGPAAASWSPSRLDVFGRGKDDRIYQAVWNGSAWSGWGPVGDGTFSSGPAAVSWGINRLDVFGRGQDDRMYHAAWNGSAWSGWAPLGVGTFSSGPAAVSWGTNRLDVFGRGKDDRIYHASWNGSAWSGWAPIGVGTFSSGPAASSWGTNRLDVFGRGKDDRMYHALWNGNAWSGWGAIGAGTFNSGPAAASVAANRLAVFGVGKDDRMYHALWNGSAWSGWGPIGDGTFTY